jgi:antitoxin VapB
VRRTAKLFKNGGSQAVRLPAEFRIDGDHVEIWRDESSGHLVIAQPRPWHSWQEFYALRDSLGGVPDDFMRDRDDDVSIRDPFAAS